MRGGICFSRCGEKKLCSCIKKNFDFALYLLTLKVRIMKRENIKRKGYRKPVMKVVKLQHHSHLLAGSYSTSGSGDGTGTKNYIWNTPTEE